MLGDVVLHDSRFLHQQSHLHGRCNRSIPHRDRTSASTLCQLFGQIYALAGHSHLSTAQRYIEANDQMMKAAVDGL
ncbi:hypothetical protein WV31_18960 [Magnetospirillum sp. ME-1]|nr:hypothetical protein WV31_18960 [Magnetospirillum sp. ME-1]